MVSPEADQRQLHGKVLPAHPGDIEITVYPEIPGIRQDSRVYFEAVFGIKIRCLAEIGLADNGRGIRGSPEERRLLIVRDAL